VKKWLSSPWRLLFNCHPCLLKFSVNEINRNNEILPFCPEPKYLGVTLHWSLTYRRHLESFRKKLTSRVALLRRLAGCAWGAGATTLRTATLALMHSTAEYSAPVWCRSVYTRLNDAAINDALRIVTACLRVRPTPADNLPIQPAEPRRNGATLSLARHAMEPGYLLHSALIRQSSAKRTAPQVETPICIRRTSNHQFIEQQQKCGALGGSPMEFGVGGQPYKAPNFHAQHRHPPLGMTLPRRAWVRLNRLRTGVGGFRSCLYKWGMASSAVCECGAEEQTVDHVVLQCPTHRPPNGLYGMKVLDHETFAWLLNTCPEI